MTWNDIHAHWPRMKRHICRQHPHIRLDALEGTEAGRRQLLQLITAKYGRSRPMADHEVSQFIGEGAQTARG